jgi:hypothetical protein
MLTGICALFLSRFAHCKVFHALVAATVLGSLVLVISSPKLHSGWWFQPVKNMSQLGFFFPTEWKVIK